MPLERDHILLYGPQVRTEDGLRIRNKVLQPCGCWSAEVWRVVEAPTGVNAIDDNGKPAATAKAWCHQTRQCGVHSAKVAVLSLELAARLGGPGFKEKIGDGARRLLADSKRVIAEADALDQELKALGGNIEMKQLPPPVTPRRIENDDEYRAALARIDELSYADDLESNGEMEAWANYVEDYEERAPHLQPLGGWVCECGFAFVVRAGAVGDTPVDSERARRIVERVSKGHRVDDADRILFAHATHRGRPCGGRP